MLGYMPGMHRPGRLATSSPASPLRVRRPPPAGKVVGASFVENFGTGPALPLLALLHASAAPGPRGVLLALTEVSPKRDTLEIELVA